jgi:hypothetical protein
MEARLPVDDDVKGALEALGADLISARDRNTVRYWDRGLLPEVVARMQAIVDGFHRERPLLSGMRTAEVFTQLLRERGVPVGQGSAVGISEFGTEIAGIDSQPIPVRLA